MGGIRKKMNEEVTRTRVILDETIEERLPVNYDVIQELAEKASALNSCTFVPFWGWYKGEKSTYIEYLTFRNVLQQFYISITIDLLHKDDIEEVTASFLFYRLLFNLVVNHEKQWHVDIFNTCETPTEAWELFNRIEYLINNFETEILLSDTEDTEDVGY